MSAWPVARLGNLVESRPSPSVVSDGEATVTAVTSGCLTSSGWSEAGLKTAQMRVADVARGTLVPGEVLVSRSNTGDLVGRVAVFPGSTRRIVATDLIYRLAVDATLVLPDYLAIWLRALQLHGYWRDRSSGASSTMKKITRTQLSTTEVPLPPLDEQRRVAARLREQVAEIGSVAAAAQARSVQVNGLAQRAIDVAIPTEGATAIGHILRTPLRSGLSRAASATANHRVLTLSSVRNGILDVGQNRPMDATDAEALANAVRPSTFYVVRGNGSLHMAGAGALSPESSEGAVLYPDLLIQVDPDPALLSVEYLALAWRAHQVRRQVETRLRTSAGIHKINLANLSTVEVPLPPLTEQRQIVARLNELLAESDRAKTALDAQRKAVDALPAALLREVFGASPVGG